MEYLKRVLGIEVLYENKALEHLPNFINKRYVSQRVFASRESSIYCRWKANISAFHGGVFAGTL